ncbi:hypothetical protein QQF64_013622 [Cirrhinus molitorella]|uniref:Uncharacterized protein n=1 Tax=Cirrhinus molitorella TaxID=172907 RepID=A0ABR3LRP7_9TELE
MTPSLQADLRASCWVLRSPPLKANVEQPLHSPGPAQSDLFAHVESLWQVEVIPYRSDRVVTRSKLDQEAIRLLQEKTV